MDNGIKNVNIKELQSAMLRGPAVLEDSKKIPSEKKKKVILLKKTIVKLKRNFKKTAEKQQKTQRKSKNKLESSMIFRSVGLKKKKKTNRK